MNHRHLFALPLLLICLLSLGCQNAHKSSNDPYKTVSDAHRHTERAKALNQRAIEMIDAGELDAAEQLLKEALAADLMFGPAHNNLGKVYFQQGKLYLAAWEFEYAIKSMPNQPEPKNNLGLVLELARKLDQASDYYQQALKLEPDNCEILGNLIRARLRQGDRSTEVRELLEQMLLKETRPTWLEWAREQHAMLAGK